MKLIVLSFFAFFLRVYHLGYQSLSNDEIFSWRYVQGKSVLEFLSQYSQFPDFHPPGYLLLLNLLSHVAPLSEFWLRFPSALAGALTTLVLFSLAQELFDRKTAWLSASFWALSGASIYYSQEARNYSLLVLVTLFQVLCCVKVFTTQTNTARVRSFALCFLSTLACFYVHYMGVCFALMTLLFFSSRSLAGGRQRAGLVFLSVLVLSGLCFFPWAQKMVAGISSWTMNKPYNECPNLLVYLLQMLDFSFSFEPLWNLPARFVALSTLHFVGRFLFLVTLPFGLYACFRQRNFSLLFVAAYVLVPIFVVFVKDNFSTSRFFYERNFIPILPFFYLLVGYSLSASKIASLHRLLICCFLSLLFFQPLVNQNFFFVSYKTEFRQLSQTISDSGATAVYVACSDPTIFDYYLGGKTKPLAELRAPFPKKFWVVGEHCSRDESRQTELSLNEGFSPSSAIWGFKNF